MPSVNLLRNCKKCGSGLLKTQNKCPECGTRQVSGNIIFLIYFFAFIIVLFFQILTLLHIIVVIILALIFHLFLIRIF